jgi:hypothetical protein
VSTQRPQVAIPDTEMQLLSSSNVAQEFQIFVALPYTYATSGKAYPVLYVLDANAFFGTATETARLLAMLNDIPEIIIVGIGYPVNSFAEATGFRTRDYTITTVDTWYKETLKSVKPDAPEYVGSGGARNFLQFVGEELMPFINTTYRTIPEDSGICGFSFGGLFALYVLFHHPHTFQRYIIGSPTVWWDEAVIFNYERDFAANNTDLSAKVFMSVGSCESERMVTGMQEMARIMQDRHYNNLELITHIFEDETHISVAPATFSRGLRAVFT